MEMQQFLPLPPQYKISVNTRVEESTANTLDHHQLFTASVRSSMYLPETINSITKESETSCTSQATGSVPMKTEVQINRHTSDTMVLHCKKGHVLQ